MHWILTQLNFYCQQSLYQCWWTGPACEPQGPIDWTGTGERYTSGIGTTR